MLATGVKTPVGIKIAGPDLATIDRIAMDVERVAKGVPGTVSTYAERPIGGRYVDVDIDRRAAARYGLNVADVQQVVRTAIPVAALLLPIAFFLSIARPDAERPNRLINLAYVGAVTLTIGMLTLGIGLLRAA